MKPAEQRADMVELLRRDISLVAAFFTDLSRCKRYAGAVRVTLPKSSRDSTSETNIDCRTGLKR